MWLFFAILAPAIFSVNNFVDKFLVVKKIRDTAVITVFSGFVALLFGMIILLLRNFQLLEVKQLFLIVSAGIFAEFGLLPYFKALSTDETSRVVPLFQISPIFVLILSALFLGEFLTTKQISGFLFILMSGFVLSAEKIEKKIFTPRKSLWYMMLASLFFAISGVIFRFVVVNANFWDTLAWELVGIGIGAIVLLLWPIYRKRVLAERKNTGIKVWSALGFNESIYMAGRLSVSYATSLAPVALVSVMNGFQPLFVLINGLILSIWFPHILKEDIQKSVVGIKLFAIALIFSGLYFIYS